MLYFKLRRRFQPLVFCLLVSTCDALDFTWTGVVSEDWNQPGNWTPAGIPTTNDAVVINSGTVTAPGNAAYAVLNLNGGTLNGAFTITTTMNWSGGTLGDGAAVTVAANGMLNLNGTAIKRLFGTVTNAGLVTWAGAGGFFFYGGTLVNATGGTFDVQNDEAFSLVSGTPMFHNVGLLRKSAGTNATTFSGVTFINSGTVDVQTGSVNFSGLSTFESGSVLTGPGLKRWSGGTVTLNGALDAQNLELSGAALAGTNTISGVLVWSGGSIGETAVVTIATNGSLVINGSGIKRVYGMLVNAGNATWADSGPIYTYNGSILNLHGATFEANSDSELINQSGSSVFGNAGLLRKSASAGMTSFSGLALLNSGEVQVQSGTMNFSGGGNGAGIFTTGAGATMVFSSGYSFDADSAVAGAGTNRWTGGNVMLDGTATVQTVEWAGATLGGTNTLTGTLIWTSGTLGTNADVTVGTTGGLRITGPSLKRVFGTLRNAGTATWSDAGDLWWYGGRMQNLPGAIFEIQNDRRFDAVSGNPVFDNQGIFRKTTGLGTTILSGVAFNNSGSVEVQTGMVDFAGGGAFGSGAVTTGNGWARWTGGHVALNGSLNAHNLELAGATLEGTNVISGTLLWTSGTLGGGAAMIIATNGTLRLGGDVVKRFYGAITNTGTVIWTGNSDVWNYGGVIHNLAGGVFEIQNDQAMEAQSAGSVFVNAGQLRKSAGTGTTAFSNVALYNSGLVRAEAGELVFAGGGSGTGTVECLAGGTATFSTGFYFMPGSFITGAGTNRLSGGSVALHATLTVQNVELAGAALTGTNTFSGRVLWTGGDISASGAVTILSGGSLIIQGNNFKRIFGVLTNAGTATWADGGPFYFYGGSIYNLSGALFEVQNDQTLFNQSGSPVFGNAGIFQKTAGIGATVFTGVPFLNSGLIEVQSGTLNLGGSGYGGGTFSATKGATLAFSSGYTFNPGSTITGDGTNRWAGGTVAFDGVATVQNAELAGATLLGTNSFAGRFIWSGGTVGSNAETTIAAGGTLQISGASLKRLYGIVINRGSSAWLGPGDVWAYGGRFYNLPGAVFEVQNDQRFDSAAGSPSFDNSGVLRKTAGTGSTTFGNVAFNNTGTVDVQIGTVDFGGGGVFNPGGIVTGAGRARWTGGIVTLTGNLTAQNLELAGATLIGTNRVSGTLAWSAGTVDTSAAMTIATNGILAMNGTGIKRLFGVVTNAGRVSWADSGSIYFYGGLVFTLPGGLFDVQTDQTAYRQSGSPVIHNAGTFRKSAGAGTATFSGVSLVNSGTVQAQSGTLDFGGGGSGTGIVDCSAGATAAFSDGFNFLPGSLVTGAGTNRLSGGNVALHATVTVQNVELGGATLTSTNTFSGRVIWTSGTIGSDSAVTILPGGFLDIAGEELKRLQSALTNGGTATWSGIGPLSFYDGFLINLPGATFDIQSDSAFYNLTGNPRFANAGLLRKSASEGITRIEEVTFSNTGIVNVLSGTLEFSGGGSGNGAFQTAAGATTVFSGGYTFSPGSLVSGAGTNRWIGGVISINGGLTVEHLELGGATLVGTNNYGGSASWSSGAIGAGGALTIAASGTLDIRGDSIKRLFGILTNAGAATWSGMGDLWVYNGRIFNTAGGIFDVQNNRVVQVWTGTPYFHNAGVLRKTAGAGTNLFAAIGFTNAGTVEIQTGMLRFHNYTQMAGTTLLNGGNLASRSTLLFSGGLLAGSGLVDGPVSIGAGTVRPGPLAGGAGSLILSGSYSMSVAGTNDFEIGGLTTAEFDRVLAGGSATLNGNFTVSLINGFRPRGGDGFEVMTFGGGAGNFASLTGLKLGDGYIFTPVYGGSDFVLLTIDTRPRLSCPQRLPGGEFKFCLTGHTNISYILQASTNLSNWVSLFTTNTTTGFLELLDTTAVGLPERYYRALVP